MIRGGDLELAVELLDENNFSEKLTDNQFVFMMHQGYMFWYINLDEGDNPAVYLYDESLDFTLIHSIVILLRDVIMVRKGGSYKI